MPRQKLLARGGDARETDERMPDELHWHAGVPINLFLERKDDEHAIGEGANRVDAPRPPRPDLRADVVNHRDAKPPDLLREPEIEVRKIDDDERVGPLGFSRGDELAHR